MVIISGLPQEVTDKVNSGEIAIANAFLMAGYIDKPEVFPLHTITSQINKHGRCKLTLIY